VFAINGPGGDRQKREEDVLFAKHARLLPTRFLVAASVLIPGLLFLGVAWLDYQATRLHAREYVIIATNALAEQTREALQTASLILARTSDRVDGMDWPAITSSREVHDFLAGIVHEMPLVQSVFLVDPQGFNSASSRAFPMQAYDNRDREYFVAAREGGDHLFISSAFLGKMTNLPGFTVSRPRLKNGRFDGVVAVTLSPAYFQGFYEKITLSTRGAAAALVRTDGRLLVRYPDSSPIGTTPIGQLPQTSPLLRAARSGADAGVFFDTADGRSEIAAFRRIEAQPVLAVFTLARSYYLAGWYVHLVWMAAFAVLTAAALLWTSLVVLRQASVEQAHLRRLLQESERRKEAEETVQHLRRMEALGRLSGGVAHDFNNLLAAIIGALELAGRRLDDPERLRHLLATATQAAERGARLTTQMLAFSRNQEISPHPLDINSVIRESDALIQRTVEALVEVSYSLDPDLWPAIGDRVQFELALLNLAGNARDAMPLGGKLVFMTRNASFGAANAAGIPPGDYVQISVTDTGEGMTAETRARAFDPFFTTKGLGKGTGLGLSQVYGFADQVGGTARIHSALGQGTTVTLWLPRAQVIRPAFEEPEAGKPEAAVALNILLVDDDQAVRVLTQEMLGELGHKVAVAENGPAAITMLASKTEFDLLLVDFAMPVMNGAQVAAEAIRLRPRLPVLFITGYADASVLNSWTQLGYRTLKKPFSAADLDRAIRQTVSYSGNVVPLRRNRG
jgi:signal transduction histidine kinase/ActR/RegA family two-component response regulator